MNMLILSKKVKKEIILHNPAAGFTLIETMAAIIIIGVLSAIAVPSWISLVSSQRVSSVRSQVFQTLKTAQNEAKRTKSDIKVEFDVTANPPKMAVNGRWQTLGMGEIKSGMIQLSAKANNTPINSIDFDYMGGVSTDPVYLTILVPGNNSLKQCVIIQTILGATREASGTDCN